MTLTITGAAAAAGIAIGKACVMRRGKLEMPRLYILNEEQVAGEVARFQAALRQTQEDLLATRGRIEA